MPRHLRALVVVCLLAASAVSARVISYAPYTNQIGVPGVGLRTNRHFALIETAATTQYSAIYGRVVLYDSQGKQEPRTIYPQGGGSDTYLYGVAVRESDGEPPMILVAGSGYWALSVDGGQTWKTISTIGSLGAVSGTVDVGGPYARSRYSNIRIGTRDVPFVAVTNNYSAVSLVAFRADGTTKELMTLPYYYNSMTLVGSDAAQRRFLLRTTSSLLMVDFDGNKTTLDSFFSSSDSMEGWITPSGAAYLEIYRSSSDISLWLYASGTRTLVDGRQTSAPNTPSYSFAVPTAGYGGAWIIRRASGAPTRLLLHDARTRVLAEQWSDPAGPEVEALHPSAAGDKVLIQVHRPRSAADPLFKDPALAVWHAGAPAPKFYDELYLSETSDKGFVHLDVDKIEEGEPFAFDAGRTFIPACCGVSAGGGGGGEVVQEWGVVRASMAQHLVLPGFGRTAGAFGSTWRTDLTLSNPNDFPVDLTLRFAGSSDAVSVLEGARTVRLQLAPRELRLVRDAAKELFGIDSAVATLFIDPDGSDSIDAAGHTYTQLDRGTYGYGMSAIDIYAAASARFPVTFAAAFQGENFRTNLVLTDVSGRGTSATFSVNGSSFGIRAVPTDVSPFGMLQRNNFGTLLGLPSQTTAALTVQPSRGDAVVSLFSVDNRTNDATFFPPDIPLGSVRTIPVVGHLTGLNGTQFRSDLFFFNAGFSARTLTLEMRPWDSPTSLYYANLTLQPREARMIPDALMKLFGRTGAARLRIGLSSGGADASVRVTSRTYAVDANGGTYGFLMPPLNSFQSGSKGDSLEILGTTLDGRFRTNLGLVDVANASSPLTPWARVEIIGTNGVVLDSFDASVPSLGGNQLNDIFRARGLEQNSEPVIIRVSPQQGMLGAYVAMVDNETNDPTYFAANLAAK
jgi:hypothetical protein